MIQVIGTLIGSDPAPFFFKPLSAFKEAYWAY